MEVYFETNSIYPFRIGNCQVRPIKDLPTVTLMRLELVGFADNSRFDRLYNLGPN